MVPPRTDSTVNNEAVHTGLNRFAYRTPKQQNPRRSGGSSGANKNRTCELILIRDLVEFLLRQGAAGNPCKHWAKSRLGIGQGGLRWPEVDIGPS